MAVLGLRFCARAFSSCGKRGPLFIAVHGPLTIVASPVVEHRLQTRRLSSCGSQAQLLRGMWDLPRPGLAPVSPALAGRLSTPAPPGKPQVCSCVLRPGCSVSPAVNPGVCPVVFLSANITRKAPGSFLLLPLSCTAPSPLLPVPLMGLHASLHLSKHKSHCVAETFCDPCSKKGNPSLFRFSPVLTAFLSFISYCFLHSACLLTSVM